MALVSNNFFIVDVYGTNSSDAVNYVVSNAVVGSTVDNDLHRAIESGVNSERQRRGRDPASVITSRFVGKIEAADLNYLKNTLEVSGVIPFPGTFYTSGGVLRTFQPAPSPTGGFQGVDANTIIEASHINAMIQKLKQAGLTCNCNCNYCTCNCNYCTCNCNFSCTCNCNYSDIRLKENIKFIEVKNGLNIYSYNYIWDKVTEHVGVMAQEILEEYSEAVIVDKNGYYMVDYSKLPI